MRLFRRGLVAVAIVVAGATIIWGPAYARGLSLVVRAAHLDGWLKTAADTQAHAWTAGPATTVPTRHGDIPARLYRPAGTIRRAAILTPGVHAMGIDEPRLRGLAGDLAASGVAVLTIALPDLVRYRFTTESVDQIEDAASWLAAQPALAPDGKVGLMGISFAGGLSVVAAGRPAVRDKIALCVFLWRPWRSAAGAALSLHGARATGARRGARHAAAVSRAARLRRRGDPARHRRPHGARRPGRGPARAASRRSSRPRS